MIIIRFKSGFELPVTCEEFTFSRSNITGEITNYNIKGIEDNKPLFFRSEDIECIWQKIDAVKMPYEWIPLKDKEPTEDGEYLVSFDDGFVATTGYYDGDFELWADAGEPLAWQPLPEPWKEKKNEFNKRRSIRNS